MNQSKGADRDSCASHCLSASDFPYVELQRTRITQAGVFRCCLATVANEWSETSPVKAGYESECDHCGEVFRLVPGEPHMMWKPLWQLSDAEKAIQV